MGTVLAFEVPRAKKQDRTIPPAKPTPAPEGFVSKAALEALHAGPERITALGPLPPRNPILEAAKASAADQTGREGKLSLCGSISATETTPASRHVETASFGRLLRSALKVLGV